MRPLGSTALQYRAYRHSLGRVHITSVEASWSLAAEADMHFLVMRPRYVGICSADIRELRGERPGRSDFGHEVVATIVESTHPELCAGDDVVLNPFVKIVRETAYAEMMYLTGSEAVLRTALAKVPTTDLQYSIAEPLACVIHAARSSRMDGTQPKLVLGAGFFGFLLYCYLDHQNVPVTLANRNPDRLADLASRSQKLRVTFNLQHHDNEFATVFLMQSRIDQGDVDAASNTVREQGEVVPFGAVDPGTDPELHAIRNRQLRAPYLRNGKHLHLQGTLDATPADLQEAIAMLGRPDFVSRLLPIFAPPLSFEQGADHLTGRAQSPQSYRKYVIDMCLGANDTSEPVRAGHG